LGGNHSRMLSRDMWKWVANARVKNYGLGIIQDIQGSWEGISEVLAESICLLVAIHWYQIYCLGYSVTSTSAFWLEAWYTRDTHGVRLPGNLGHEEFFTAFRKRIANRPACFANLRPTRAVQIQSTFSFAIPYSFYFRLRISSANGVFSSS